MVAAELYQVGGFVISMVRTMGLNEELFTACFNRDPSGVANALHLGADPNAENDFKVGLHPLMVAAELDEVEIVQTLLRNGANPALKDDDDKNAAHFTRDKKILQMLDFSTHVGKTALTQSRLFSAGQ